MALSDDLKKLADRANEAEDRAAKAREKARTDIEADREAARAAGEEEAKALREMAEDAKSDVSDWWTRGSADLGRGGERGPRGHCQQEGGARSAQGTAKGRPGRGRRQVRDRLRLLGDRRGRVRGSGRDPGKERGRGAVGAGGCNRLRRLLGQRDRGAEGSGPRRPPRPLGHGLNPEHRPNRDVS